MYGECVNLRVGKEGKVGISQGMSLGESGEAKTLELPMTFSPMDFGLAFFKTLSGASVNYELDYTVAGTTPGGPLNLSNKTGGVAGMK